MTYYPSSANLLPGRDGYDVGSPAAPWQDGYFSQSISIGLSSPPSELSVAGDGYFTGFVRVGDTPDSPSVAGAGAIKYSSGELQFSTGSTWRSSADTNLSNISSTAISTDLLPSTDDAYGLGSSSTRWKDGYFGPNSLHLVSTSGETGTATHWSFRVDPLGNLRLDETSAHGGIGLGDVVVNELLTVGGAVAFKDGYVPSATTGYGKAYVKNDGKLYFLTSTGTEYDLTAGGGGGGTPAGSSGAVQFNAAGSFGADTANFFWDDTANSLGIGTSTPLGSLDVRGAVWVGIDDTATTSVLKGFSVGHSATNATSRFRFGVADGSFSGMTVESERTGSFNSELIAFYTHQGGVAQRRALEISYTGAITMNSGGYSTANLTVQGDTDSALLFTDAAADKVGIGTGSPVEKLTLVGVQALAHTTAPSATSGYGKVYVKSADAKLYFKNASGTEYDLTAAGAAAGSSGAVQFNSSGLFGADASNFFWDDTNDRLGIGTGSPSYKFHLAGGTQASGLVRTFHMSATLPNGTTYEESFRFDTTSGGTGGTGNGCRGGLFYLRGGYSGAADVYGVVNACEGVSTGATSDPVSGAILGCGASAVLNETYGVSTSGINSGAQNWAAQALFNIGNHNAAGFVGFSENGFVQNSTNVATINTVNLTKHSASTTERHIGSVDTAAGGNINIGGVSGIGLTRSRIEAYTSSATHVFDNGTSSGTPLWRGLNNGTQNSALFAEGQLLITGLSTAISTKTTTYTITSFDHTILADASGGAFTVNLPAAANAPGWEFVILKKDSSGNAVTVDADGSETINGATTVTLSAQYDKVRVKSDGSAWFIV